MTSSELSTEAVLDAERRRHSLLAIADRYLTWVTTPLLILAFIGLWKLYIVVFNVSPFMLPPPEAVGKSLLELMSQPFFWNYFRITVTEIVSGFAIAVVIGAVLGVLLGKLKLFERIASPFIVASQVTPKVALMPLFLLWMGFGMQSKIAMVVLLSFFPVMKSTILGVRSISPEQRDLFTVIQAPGWKRVWSLDIPAVLPYLLTGVETASVLAVTGAIVGEYLGGNEGLGAMVVMTLNAMRVDQMFATIVALACFGFIFYALIASIRKVAVPWHDSAQQP
ncbi:ABC transporter permease [Chelativorans sp. Marseille-P2723]|uniref:ABC transporter permease n=1 Tax=Chelativorans sp. Marseille-P2723 TaxID=2709133 RepID=UPI001AEF0FBE|nr:ABC transporter permease [Chelativorans sp. Marseille-P2723]